MSGNRLSSRVTELIAENRIATAMEEGQFDNLPGLGQPIPDIDEPYDPLWWIKKWIRREQVGQALAQGFGKDWSK
jgi:Domain of unknown function (DUF1992)